MTDPTAPDRQPTEPAPAAPDVPPTTPISPAETEATIVLGPDTGAVQATGPVPASPTPVSPVPTAPVTPSAAGTRGAGRLLGYLGVAVLGIAIGAGGLAVASRGLGTASPSPAPTPLLTPSPTAPPSGAPAGNTVGRADAPVSIEVWADYQCPFCQREDLLFQASVLREYVVPGIARLTFRDFAFLGQESIDAAVAARCAGAQEPAAQSRYHDTLFFFQAGENQGRFARENLLKIAEIAGVPNADAFAACLDDPAVAQAVADETTAGRNVGISSTPTMRLRGPGGERVLTGFSQTWPTLRDAINAVAGLPTPSPAASPAPVSPAPSPSASPGASATPAP